MTQQRNRRSKRRNHESGAKRRGREEELHGEVFLCDFERAFPAAFDGDRVAGFEIGRGRVQEEEGLVGTGGFGVFECGEVEF